MSVQRGVAAAVGDDHIIAVGAGILGHDDSAGLGGVNGTGVAHPPDVGAFMVCGADAAGGGPAAHRGGDIAAVHRPDVAAGVGLRGLTLGRLLLRQLFGQAKRLGQNAVLLCIQCGQRLLVFLLVIVDCIDHGDGLLALLIQLRLFAHKVRLGGFPLSLAVLQLLLLLRDLHLEGLQVVDDLLVSIHDLVYIIEPG